VLAICCDPEGKVAIHGSNEDRRILQEALDYCESRGEQSLITITKSAFGCLVVKHDKNFENFEAASPSAAIYMLDNLYPEGWTAYWNIN
jgi:hypothetical protein